MGGDTIGGGGRGGGGGGGRGGGGGAGNAERRTIYELYSKLLQRAYIADSIGDYCRGY